MTLVRATKDCKLGTDTIKKGCIGIVNGHTVFHAAMVTHAPMGPVYEPIALPQEGFENVEVPGDSALELRIADRLRWSMDPADPFTNEVSALLKEILREKPLAAEHLSMRLIELT